MYQDRVLSFIDLAHNWEKDLLDKSLNLSLSTFIGDPKDCVIFSRACNIEDMETEDDERYVFSLPDYSVTESFSRFETRRVFVKLNKNFNHDKIEVILKMAWNYPKVVVNQKTTEFKPFSDQYSNLPPVPPSGGPPIRKHFID